MLSTIGSIASQGGGFKLYAPPIDILTNLYKHIPYAENTGYITLTKTNGIINLITRGSTYYDMDTGKTTKLTAKATLTNFTKDMIDITPFKTLFVDCDFNAGSGYTGFSIQAGDNVYSDTFDSYSYNKAVYFYTSFSRTVIALDISELTGIGKYIQLKTESNSAVTATLNVYKVWLE